MPELPEVETIKRGLEKKIIGLTIKDLVVLNQKSVQFDPQKTRGRDVLNIWRRAKMLGINLSGDLTILFHLKMTGQLIFVGAFGDKVIGGHPTESMLDKMPNKDTRAIFHFENNSSLYFNDQIKFGWIRLIQTSKLEDQEELKKLGPEPLGSDFTWEILKENLLKHKKMPIKVALMDQSLLAGVGNIYASEALFLAKVDPKKPVGSLSDGEFKKLYNGIRHILEESIKYGGTTIKDYVNTDGERGEFLSQANVYGRVGQPCKYCKGKIVKITQSGRGTYFCPACQK